MNYCLPAAIRLFGFCKGLPWTVQRLPAHLRRTPAQAPDASRDIFPADLLKTVAKAR